MRSPILAFFSPPASPTHTPAPVPSAATTKSESNVTLFTHQDGKKFEVTIVRLDEAVDLDDADSLRGCREEDWDSDDWDEDAEDWAEPAPQHYPQPRPQLRLHLEADQIWTAETELGMEHRRAPKGSGVNRLQDRTVHDWDGDAEDLEEQPVAKWNERPERPDWVRRERDADVWRTRLGED